MQFGPAALEPSDFRGPASASAFQPPWVQIPGVCSGVAAVAAAGNNGKRADIVTSFASFRAAPTLLAAVAADALLLVAAAGDVRNSNAAAQLLVP